MAHLLNGKPVIGIILDENTSTGGDRYEAHKGYFEAVARAGGIAIGLPYSGDSLAFAEAQCAGLVSTGARIRFPADWYANRQESGAPQSDRFDVERALVTRFLDLDRPYFGICNGMQMLACLSGGAMTANAKAETDGRIAHDDRETRHGVSVLPGTRLAGILAGEGLGPDIVVNSFHREAVLDPGPQAIVSARSEDGLIEAIERPSSRFALGVQWHPERMIAEGPVTDALMRAFVKACAF